MSLREPFAATAVFIFSLLAFLKAGEFHSGAEIFPRAIAAIMIVCSALLFCRSVIWPAAMPQMPEGRLRRIALSILMTIAFAALIVPLGFLTATLIYIPTAAYAMGLRSHASIWAATLMFVVILHVLFRTVFHTPLPQELVLRLLGYP